MIKKTWVDDLFQKRIILFYNYDSLREVAKYIEKDSGGVYSLDDEGDAAGVSVKYEDGSGKFTQGMAIKEYNSNVFDIAVVAHEIGHMVFDLMKEAGIPISKENDETFLYLHSYWLRKILDFIVTRKL